LSPTKAYRSATKPYFCAPKRQLWHYGPSIGACSYNGSGTRSSGLAGRPDVGPIGDPEVRNPSDMYALGDARLIAIWPKNMAGTANMGGEFRYRFQALPWITLRDFLQHGTAGLNMAFVDGHCATVRHTDLFAAKSAFAQRWNRDNLP